MTYKAIAAIFLLLFAGELCYADELLQGSRERDATPPRDAQTRLGRAVSDEVSRRNEMINLEEVNFPAVARTEKSEEIRDPLTGGVVQRTLFGEGGSPRRIERFDPDGTPVSTTSFDPGNNERTETLYALDGKVRQRAVYRNDVLESSTDYQPDGSRTVIRKSGETPDGKPVYAAEPAPNS